MAKQQTFEGHQLRSEIAERGYAEFEHGIPGCMIDLAIERYASFTLAHPNPQPSTMDAMLPPTPPNLLDLKLDDLDRSKDTEDTWHKYRTNVPGVGKPDGYTSRIFQDRALQQARGVRLGEDPKEFYHHTTAHYAHMVQAHEQYAWGSIPPEVTSLNTALAPIHTKARELITRVCMLIEETHPEINDFITPQSLSTSPLRLLFYHPGTGLQLAGKHYDKSMMTAQIAESHRGLRVAVNNKEESPLVPVVRDASKAVFFAATDLAARIDRNTLYQPGWHDVIQMDELNLGRSVPITAAEVCARYALVFFANAHSFVDGGKTITHKRRAA